MSCDVFTVCESSVSRRMLMTFTFTMDAFPGYTKFEPTKKVLAILQIVEDESDVDEGDRASCEHPESPVRPFNQTVTLGGDVTGVTAELTSNTKSAATINVSGTDVTAAFDTNTFGAYDGNAVEIIINLPTEVDGTYTVKQTNPALAYYVGKDQYVSLTNGQYVKEKDYEFTANENPEYSILASDEAGAITVELINKDTGKTVKTYTINTSGLTFA